MSNEQNKSGDELDGFNLDEAFGEWDTEDRATSPGEPAERDSEGNPPASPKAPVPKPAPPADAKPPVPKPAPPAGAKPPVPKPAPPGQAKDRPLYRPPTPGQAQTGVPKPAVPPGSAKPAVPRPAPPAGTKPPVPRPAVPKPAPPAGAKPPVPKPAPPSGAHPPGPKPAPPKPPGPRPAPPAPKKAPAPPKPSPKLDDFADFGDDDEDAATAIGEIPEDLITSLKQAEESEHERPTKPPPPAPDEGQVDLDLDDLLGDLGEPTSPSAGDAPAAGAAEPRPAPSPPVSTPSPASSDQLVARREGPHPGLPSIPPQEEEDEVEIEVEEGPVDEEDLLADLDDFAAPAEEIVIDEEGEERDRSSEAPTIPPDERPTTPPPPGTELPTAESGALRAPAAPALTDADDDLDDRPTPVPPPLQERSDQGAAAAKRTVRYRKPREEHFPLVGRTHDAMEARRELLSRLAEGARGAQKARMLVATAELDEQLGEFDRAHDTYRRAHEADARDLMALRALRRYAVSYGDWGEVAELLEAEAGLALSNDDKAYALELLAEVQMQQLGDPAAAEQHARTATALRKGQVAPLVLLAETCFAQGKKQEGLAAMEKAAGAWEDPRVRGALLCEVAFAAERAGHQARSAALFERAVEADPDALDGWLGLARVARASGDLDVAVRALGSAAERTGGPLPELLRRLAARALHLVADRPADSVALLSDARSLLALQARADAAAAAGDAVAREEAVASWAATAGGTERALGLVALAELRADAGDLDGADAALRDAALADGKLGTVRVVRELLARKAGDASRLARAVQTTDEGGALGAAAKTARDPRATQAERELLARAVEEGENPVAADVLGLDAAAALQDGAATAEALRRQAERAGPEQRLGALLSLGRFFLERADASAAKTVLREARDLFPGDPLPLRPLSRLVAPEDPTEAAAMWLEEASVSEGVRAAFAATWAGRILARGGGDAGNAYRRALDVQPGYAPAAWALEPIVRAQGDTVTLEEIHEQLAETEGDPIEAAGRRVRAALLRGERDPQGAVELLERALQSRPQDAIVYELMLRLAGATTPEERAQLLESSSEGAPPEVARSARLRAAAAWLDADDPGRAAALYEKVLTDHPDDPYANEAVDRTLVLAGQPSRVRQRRAAAVKRAAEEQGEGTEPHTAALEALADFDLHELGDREAAVQSREALLKHAPGHVPSLRALETHYMDRGRDGDLERIVDALVEHLGAPEDLAGHLRLAVRMRLRADDVEGSAADDLVLTHAARAAPSLWLSRHVEGAARAKGDPGRVARALTDQVERLDGPNERASLRIRIAEALEAASGPQEAAEALAPAVDASPDHPAAAEVLGRLRAAAGDPRAAAESYETAAEASTVPRRQVLLWHRAGVTWQDDVQDAERAVAAFERAAELDIKHADLFDRMRVLLTERDDTARLSRLVEQRLEAGGDPESMVGLHLARADLCEQLGDRDGARQALREALELDADRVEALRRLADLSMQDGDWRGATEALIRVARLRQDRDELRWVFFHLGDIYDRHMPDPQRAEQAYRRVLKLAPDDLETWKRLADFHQRNDQREQALEAYRELIGREPDPERRRDHRLELARVLEESGDLRDAEGELEEARRGRPTDLAVLQAVAGFYKRQGAESALAMHLSRAVSDLRQSALENPLNEPAWHTLVEVQRSRGRPDAARCCASVAAALGVLDIELARLLDPRGGVPGAGAAANTAEVEEALAPPELGASTRRVFAVASEALEKVLPVDLKQLRAEKAGRDAPVRREAVEIMQHLGGGDVQVYLTDAVPRGCMPITASPVTILVGRDLLASTDAGERRFLLLRAARAAQAGLGVAVRSDPDHLRLAVGAMMHAYDPAHEVAGADPAQIADLAKRIKKAVPRRARDELGPLLLEMAGAPGFDPAKLGPAASTLGDRFALVALGAFPAALSGLLKTMTDRVPGADQPQERARMVRQSDEAWDLLEFALSDAHFTSRERAGADRL